MSYAKLSSLVAKGAVIKTTNITENFTYEHFLCRYGDGAMPLLYIKDKKLHVITANTDAKLPGDIELISLISSHALQETKPAAQTQAAAENTTA